MQQNSQLPLQQNVDLNQRIAITSQYLTTNGWPIGLQESFFSSLSIFPVRFFIVDDSGSMSTCDGKHLVPTKNGLGLSQCSRWVELGDALRFHAGLAEVSSSLTEFRLLNGAPPIVLGQGNDNGTAHRQLLQILERPPGGGTPLCKHIQDVTNQIRSMETQLRANAQKAVVVIATDGESSDGDMATAMKPLEKLPVWIVIRLCTDDDKIVEYWNNIDKDLELEMDILDDVNGEAGEIYQVNDWLNYGEPMHRMREWGSSLRELDLIDEALLSPDQMKVVVSLLLSLGPAHQLPNPELEWDNFIHIVHDAILKQPNAVWNPLQKKLTPWINYKNLRKRYEKSKCLIS